MLSAPQEPENWTFDYHIDGHQPSTDQPSEAVDAPSLAARPEPAGLDSGESLISTLSRSALGCATSTTTRLRGSRSPCRNAASSPAYRLESARRLGWRQILCRVVRRPKSRSSSSRSIKMSPGSFCRARARRSTWAAAMSATRASTARQRLVERMQPTRQWARPTQPPTWRLRWAQRPSHHWYSGAEHPARGGTGCRHRAGAHQTAVRDVPRPRN